MEVLDVIFLLRMLSRNCVVVKMELSVVSAGVNPGLH